MTTVTYRRLFAIANIRSIAVAMLLSRVGDSMFQLVLVLFVLDRFHSPTLAGFSLVAGQVPGKLVSPIAGALLDRFGRKHLVLLDYTLAALTTGAIALLGELDVLTPPVLVTLLLLAGTTQPLSTTGLRSLFPLLLPRRMWDRANAVDSGTFLVAGLVGPGLGGVVVGLLGGEAGVALVAALFAVAAVVTLTIGDVGGVSLETHSVIAAAWVGLQYVVRNPTLRGLAIVMSLLSIGGGILLVALPVLVMRSLGGSATLTGLLFACYGCTGLVSGMLFGRRDSEGQEVAALMIGNGLVGAGMLLLAVGGPLAAVVVALLVAGIGIGPADIAMFGLRQRRTDPEVLSRALAISMALNSAGTPIGAAIAGALVATHLPAAFLVAGVGTILAVCLAAKLIPQSSDPTLEFVSSE